MRWKPPRPRRQLCTLRSSSPRSAACASILRSTSARCALAVNPTAALLLFRFREGDANVRSVWLCSRNDAIGNVAVMLAALGVRGTGTAWPDLAVAAIMSALFLYSASSILRQSIGEFRVSGKRRAVPAE